MASRHSSRHPAQTPRFLPCACPVLGFAKRHGEELFCPQHRGGVWWGRQRTVPLDSMLTGLAVQRKRVGEGRASVRGPVTLRAGLTAYLWSPVQNNNAGSLVQK